MFNKNHKQWIVGSALGLALAGGLMFSGSAYAQTSTTTPTATAITTATVPGASDGATAPVDGFGRGGGGGRGGHGGDGGIKGFGAATADGAANAITRASESLALVKTDLDYATGKTDTASVQGWLSDADALIVQANSAVTAQQYGQAAAYAQAAQQLAQTAKSSLAAALGAENLPSYSTDTAGHQRSADSTSTAPTQAQASRQLYSTYNSIVSANATAGSDAAAAKYLDQAEAAYASAYSAYGSGDYAAATQSAKLANNLVRVATTLAGASTAPANADSPVSVPAPNF